MSSLRHDSIVVHDPRRLASISHDRLRRDLITWIEWGPSLEEPPQKQALAQSLRIVTTR
jgi:hypothetical protein